MTILVPYHLDQRIDGFSASVGFGDEVTVDLPPSGPWQRMTVVYERVAQLVAAADGPVTIVSGDCTTSLGVLTGLQRGGHDPGVVWLDAHADFHTEATTTSGYLGGMPLALAAGVGTLTLPAALGLRSVPDHRIMLVDARDTDPGERDLLDRSNVRRTGLDDLDDLPDGDLYLHVDLDVCDATAVPDLLYPVPGGPTVSEVVDAVRRIAATGRVLALGIAATWRHDPPVPAHRTLIDSLRAAIG